jgi:hypothetical protein
MRTQKGSSAEMRGATRFADIMQGDKCLDATEAQQELKAFSAETLRQSFEDNNKA